VNEMNQTGSPSRRSFLQRASLAGLGVAFAGPLLEACSSSSSSSTSPATAASPNSSKNAATGQGLLISAPTNDNVYWNEWSGGGKAAAAVFGMKQTYDVFNGDEATQIAEFNNMAVLGNKGVYTIANNSASSPQLMGICQSSKVYGVNTWSNQPWSTPLDIGQYFLQYYEVPNQLGFDALCTFLFQKMGGKGKVIHISGTPSNLASAYRDLGVQDALKKFPNIQVVAKEYGGFSRVTTAPVIENLLTAHPDVQAVICQNDDSAMGALPALQKSGSKAYVTGADGIPEFLDAIASGTGLATMAHSGPWLGGACTARIFDALNGVTLNPLERMATFEAFIVNTGAAAQAYKKLVYGTSGYPFDFAKMSRFLHPNDWDMQSTIKMIQPNVFWSAFESQKPSGYQLPAPYRSATSADYAQLEAMYESHHHSDPFAAVKKLNNPILVVG